MKESRHVHPRSIGALEFSCIGPGFGAQDEMLKAATVELLVARTICSGQYLVIVGGLGERRPVGGRYGLQKANEAVIDHMIIANAHDSLFPALGQSVVLRPEDIGALGVIESFSGTSVLAAADAAAKAGNVIIFRIHVAMALGGKGLLLMTGSVADVRAGMQAGVKPVRDRGLLVSQMVIPQPSPDLFEEYL